jgi:hypothetical protein
MNVWMRRAARRQGDQVGRIFAFWVIVFFGQFLRIIEGAKVVGLLLFHGQRYVLHKFALAAWCSGHHIRLRNKKTRVRIPPGYRVFRKT